MPQPAGQVPGQMLHWLYWFAWRAELGELLGNPGGCSEVGGAAVGTPEQHNTSLDGDGGVSLPWRPMRQLEIGCHGNQFGSLWGHPTCTGPQVMGMVLVRVVWDGWDSRMLQSRAEPPLHPPK